MSLRVNTDIVNIGSQTGQMNPWILFFNRSAYNIFISFWNNPVYNIIKNRTLVTVRQSRKLMALRIIFKLFYPVSVLLIPTHKTIFFCSIMRSASQPVEFVLVTPENCLIWKGLYFDYVTKEINLHRYREITSELIYSIFILSSRF